MAPVSRIVILLFFASFAANVSAQFNYANFCDVSDFTLNGVTGSLNPNGDCVLRLTNNLAQSGSAFLTNTVSLAGDASFSTAFSFRFTNQQNTGADGIVFVVQTVANNVGGGGGGIGYQGISDSVGVEFDNWFNSGVDPDASHIGIDLEGSVDSVVTANVSPDLDNGEIWYAWVDYNGVTDLLEARISPSPARPAPADVSYTVDLVMVLGQTDAFLGFTSGTGAASAWHDVLSWQFNPFFDPIGDGEEDRATFAVAKNFNDDNEAEVEVTLSCNTGLPLEQTTAISEGDPVNFVIVDFEPGDLDCEVTESVPSGYTASYNDGTVSATNCSWTDIQGGPFQCLITNSLDLVEIVVTKEWLDENPQFNTQYVADADWSCSNVAFGQSSGFLQFFTNPDEDSFFVYPDWEDGTTCDVTEVALNESGVEVDDSDCQDLVVFPGEGSSCTIVNTRLYEGIPTLSQYGLAVLALLMLGVGLLAYRRMA